MNELPKELLDLLNEQYEPQEVQKILEGYKKEKYTTFRINTLKANAQEILKQLQTQNVILKQVSWYPSAYYIENQNDQVLRNFSGYTEGKIYIQSLSSMLPVLCLNPKENTQILDMTAAPGSKTTQIAAQTNNKSQITACEINPIRYEKLMYNLNKQGVNCCTVLKTNALQLDPLFSFDQVLLDAPCSGSGTIQRNKEVKNRWDKKTRQQTKQRQLALLKKAIDLLKPNQTMIYSTCSILKEENEEIIQSVMKEKKVHVIPLSIGQDIPTLPNELPGTITICPNEYFEGFFIACLKKEGQKANH